MASRCTLCGKSKKQGQPTTMWKSQYSGFYEVHSACFAFQREGIKAKEKWDMVKLKRKK